MSALTSDLNRLSSIVLLYFGLHDRNLTICFFTIHLEEEPQTPATPADPKVTQYGDVIE